MKKNILFTLLGLSMIISSCKSIYIDALNNSSDLQVKLDCKKYYKDGETFLYYTSNNVSVSAQLSINRNYGKYYMVNVVVENFTGESFNFNPTDIYSILIKNGENIEGDVFSHNRYMKKVRRSQNWSEALNGLAEGLNAAQAGYSTSTTTISGVSNYNSLSNNSGNSNNTNSASIYGSYNQSTPLGNAGASGSIGARNSSSSKY